MYIGIVALVIMALIAGGAYVFMPSSEVQDEMMKNDSPIEQAMEAKNVMEKDSMVKDAMQKDAMPGDTMQNNAMKDEGSMSGGAMMTHGGTYEAYSSEKIAWAKDGKVVLFFRASWCPTCKAVDSDIRNKLSSIPKDVTILDVNYDTETALRQKYGVTYQHTFVQVDASGNQVAKWSGSPTLAALVSNVK